MAALELLMRDSTVRIALNGKGLRVVGKSTSNLKSTLQTFTQSFFRPLEF